MSIESVRQYLKQFGAEGRVIEFPVSSATVELAAEAAGVIPARIAKTLSFKDKEGDGCILIATAGDAKVDNGKFKQRFQMKAKMLTGDEVLALTGHAIGGVCPFDIKDTKVQIYTDISMKRFDTMFPACGSSSSAIELTCEELFKFAGSLEWIDVCKNWQEEN